MFFARASTKNPQIKLHNRANHFQLFFRAITAGANQILNSAFVICSTMQHSAWKARAERRLIGVAGACTIFFLLVSQSSPALRNDVIKSQQQQQISIETCLNKEKCETGPCDINKAFDGIYRILFFTSLLTIEKFKNARRPRERKAKLMFHKYPTDQPRIEAFAGVCV